MSVFTAKDTNPVSWEEFDRLVNTLVSKITESGIRVDVVAPLLRTGGIVGGILSIKMKVLTMLPVQFKYSYNPTVINQILSVPDILGVQLESMNVLLCEGNTSSGSIAMKAAAAIKEKYPQAKIYLATVTRVFGGAETLEAIEQIFYGQETDENFKATEEEKQKRGMRLGITLFPWESVEDELSDLNATQ